MELTLRQTIGSQMTGRKSFAGTAMRSEWPSDANGNVLRQLAAVGFNFARPHEVDFHIDFLSWPPATDAIPLLCARYARVTVDEEDRSVVIQLIGQVSYEFVTRMQTALSDQIGPFGGICQSWGVIYEPGTD